MHPIQAITDKPYGQFPFGTPVIFTNNKKECTGVITYSFNAGNGRHCFHVRDDYGNYWHRLDKEIRPVADEPEMVAAN